jgi:hypothetical protein
LVNRNWLNGVLVGVSIKSRPSKNNITLHSRGLGDLDQPAGGHAVGALLVFLDLLEGDAEGRSELLLSLAVPGKCCTIKLG